MKMIDERERRKKHIIKTQELRSLSNSWRWGITKTTKSGREYKVFRAPSIHYHCI